MTNKADAGGYLERLADVFMKTLSRHEFRILSVNTKSIIINILFALRLNKQKIRLLLINLHGLVEGVLAEDCLIGLEIEANEAIKVRN